MPIETPVIANYASSKLSTDQVELYLTHTGGHLAPVNFHLPDRTVSPYAMNPWVDEPIADDMPNLIKVLRGDFFCLPFGVSDQLPHPHGATANNEWTLLSSEKNKLVLEIEPDDIGGKVTKEVSLRDGQYAIYQKHTITGIEGSYNYGHHPIIEFPEQGGPFAIHTSPFIHGQVYPGAFEDPANGGHSSLKEGAIFTSLDQVPMADGSTTSLAQYPAREGFEDLVLFSAAEQDLAWTAVTLDGYAWISLKNPKQFPSTLFWISNGGRHYQPWNGRHKNRIGIEDVCSYFHEGLDSSRSNKLPHGIATTADFSKDKPTELCHIQMVHPLPGGFCAVEHIRYDSAKKGIWLSDAQGQEIFAPVDCSFLGY
jgi:hypothetical protein